MRARIIRLQPIYHSCVSCVFNAVRLLCFLEIYVSWCIMRFIRYFIFVVKIVVKSPNTFNWYRELSGDGLLNNCHAVFSTSHANTFQYCVNKPHKIRRSPDVQYRNVQFL